MDGLYPGDKIMDSIDVRYYGYTDYHEIIVDIMIMI